MSEVINLHEAKTHLSRLVDRAAAGEELVIARGGRPIARLVALEPARPRRELGLARGEVTIAPSFEDIPDAFAELLGVSRTDPVGLSTAGDVRTPALRCPYGGVVIKKLTRSGNSVALVLDRGLLEAAGLDADALVQVSTDGRVIVVAPAAAPAREEKLAAGLRVMHGRYAGAFKRLAE